MLVILNPLSDSAFGTEFIILTNVMLANVSRPSKTRSAFAAMRFFSVMVNVLLNAQSVSPIPE